MATPKKTKTFSVSADVHLWTSVPITAASLEDALERARSMTITDFITIDGEHNDSQFEIAGVSDDALPSF